MKSTDCGCDYLKTQGQNREEKDLIVIIFELARTAG